MKKVRMLKSLLALGLAATVAFGNVGVSSAAETSEAKVEAVETIESVTPYSAKSSETYTTALTYLGIEKYDATAYYKVTNTSLTVGTTYGHSTNYIKAMVSSISYKNTSTGNTGTWPSMLDSNQNAASALVSKTFTANKYEIQSFITSHEVITHVKEWTKSFTY